MSFFFEQMFNGGEGFHHFGGGGHPGGGHESDHEEVDTNKFYEELGVSKSATQEEIKKAYKLKAKKLHPDRHPNEKEKYQELFAHLQKAHETLSDPHKRKLYDKYGEKGVKHGGSAHPAGMSDIFDMFGGGGSRSKNRSGPKKSPSIKRTMSVTLADFYQGSTKSITITKYTSGAGSKKCAKCEGKGAVITLQRMGPMTIQQQQSCRACDGMGFKLSTTKETVDVHIPAGARHGESYTIQGVGHEYPEHAVGDLVITFQQIKDETFKRQGADLGMTHEISLREALCGYRLRVKHVSGKNLLITPKEHCEIVQPGSIKCVYAYGMPQRYSPHVKGHLYIVMDVMMPLNKHLSNKQRNEMKKLLSLCGESKVEEDEEEKKKESDGKKKKKNSYSFAKNLHRNMNKKKGKIGGVKKMDLDESDDDGVEEVEAETIDEAPKPTPAAARGQYDQDEEEQGVQCKQM